MVFMDKTIQKLRKYFNIWKWLSKMIKMQKMINKIFDVLFFLIFFFNFLFIVNTFCKNLSNNKITYN